MTLSNIYFDERKFIKSIIDKYYSNDNEEDSDAVFDDYFSSFFPNDVICEEIRNKYYLNEYNESLYIILLSKFDDFLIQDEESDAETEEIDLDDIDEISRNIYISTNFVNII